MQDTRRFKLQHCIRLPRLIRGPARSEPVRIQRHGPQVVFGPLQPGSQNPPCHSRNCSILRLLRPLAVSPANRTMMPTVRNPKLMAMPLIRSREMRCMNSKNPMSNLRMARMTHPSTRPRRNARGSQSPLPSTVMCLQILCLNRTTRIVPKTLMRRRKRLVSIRHKSSVLVLNGSMFRVGAENKCPKMTMKEKSPE